MPGTRGRPRGSRTRAAAQRAGNSQPAAPGSPARTSQRASTRTRGTTRGQPAQRSRAKSAAAASTTPAVPSTEPVQHRRAQSQAQEHRTPTQDVMATPQRLPVNSDDTAAAMAVLLDTLAQQSAKSSPTVSGRAATQRTRREVAAPTYDGTGTYSFADFVEDFIRVSDFNGWDDRDRSFHLWNSITGNAKIKVKAVPYTANFTTMLAQLSAVFTCDRALEAYRDQLAASKRKAEVDLDTYGHILLDRARKAFPDSSPTEQERLAREKFIETAGPPKMHFWLKALKPLTLQSAIDMAMQYETASTVLNATKPSASASPASQVFAMLMPDEEPAEPKVASVASSKPSPTKSELVKLVSDLNRELAAMREAKGVNQQAKNHQHKNGSKDKSQIKCFRCGRKGHFKRDCKTKLPSNKDNKQKDDPKNKPNKSPKN